MTRVLRILHTRSGRHFIVDGPKVYAERSPGQIGPDGLMLGPDGGIDPQKLVNAAAYFTERYEEPCPGTPYVVDGDFICAGQLNVVETQRFKDGRDVAAVRTALERHLDFFDRDTADGRITFGENWRGWRRLGYGFFRSLVGAIGAALVFGRIARRFRSTSRASPKNGGRTLPDCTTRTAR